MSLHDYIYDTEDLQDMKDDTIDYFQTNLRTSEQFRRQLGKSLKPADLRILILNTPCHGFGDIVFAMKLADYLREWYGAKVTIASTEPKKFATLGVKGVVALSGGSVNCRRLRLLSLPKNTPEADLIFVAPMAADYDIRFSDVKTLVPYADVYNTYFFSEYNDDLEKGFDFPTGVGPEYLGLMLTDMKKPEKRVVSGKYYLAYITDNDDYAYDCMESFIGMVLAKNKSGSVTFVVPQWVTSEIEEFEEFLLKKGSRFGKIVIKTKKGRVELKSGTGSVLTLDSSPLPLNYRDMNSLIAHSEKDILLTGDQSITDALSCCPRKNIFYQRVGWKEDFADELAKEMPNRFLRSEKTCCGSLRAIDWNSNYTKFLKRWDFRKNARGMMDAVVSMAYARKRVPEITELFDDILS